VSERTAVYRVFDAEGALLYVGISNKFGTRWEHHASMQPWWPLANKQTVEWHPDRDTAEAIEVAAIKTECPRFNVIHAIKPPKPPTERAVLPPSTYRTTTEVAAMAKTSRFTVEREVHRGNLTAEKVGNRWAIAEAEAERWAAEYRPYAEQRDRDRRPSA
jgi:excisionase family DNA binding protein